MSKQSDFYGSVYNTAKELGATETQAHLAASQASLETGYGQHVVGNNYFGVKASSSYDGPTVTANTSEGEDAVSNRMDQTFRAYDGLKASVANYMDVMSNAFPDAWNATNIADAAKGLVSGKFGRYAKDINYPGKIQSIASKLGAQQKYAYAQNPENVPVPFSPEDSPYASSQQAQATDGLSGLLNPVSTQTVAKSELSNPGEWGIINGVTPALGPTVEGWSAMASADPVQAPTGGLLSAAPAQNNFADMAAAGPFGGQFASPADRMGLLSAPSISQADISRALSNPTSQGMDPSFTAGLMGPSNPVVPTSVETTSYAPTGILSAPETSVAASRFATPETSSRFQTAAIDPSRMPMSIDPATNTQSFMDQPVGNGIYSPEHLAVQAQAEKQLAASRGLLSSYAAPTSVTPAEQAINSVATPGMSPQQIGGYQQAANTMAQAGMLNIGQQPPTDLSGNLPTNFNVLSPAIETVSVPDQPAISEQPTIEGPATTPAVSQQTQQAVTQQAAQQTLGDKFKAAMNPGTAIGGILGGATLGPIGGILGGLLGNAINQNGFSGLGGLLGNQAPVGTNYGFNPGVVAGIYGGGYAPGTSATASDGSRISAQGGGDTARTNTYGVTDVENSYGGYSADWSGWY